jgi:hypothetical protein
MPVLALSALLFWSGIFSNGGSDGSSYLIAKREIKHVLATTRFDDGSFKFTRARHRFYHSARPFQTYDSKFRGVCEFSEHGAVMFVADTLIGKKKNYASYQMIDQLSFGEIPYGDSAISGSSAEDREEYLYQSGVYSPALILQDFLQQPAKNFIRLRQGILDSISYRGGGDRRITIVIDPKSYNVLAIDVVYPDDLYGDVLRRVEYDGYQEAGKARYATHAAEHTFGLLTNDLSLTRANDRTDSSQLLSKIPEEYELGEVVTPPKETMVSGKLDTNIYFIELKQAESRVLIVNFKDYLLIGEAPLTSENGELIVKKAHEMFPGKPIKYFLFGHHHPSYLGGIRTMVHEGATVLSVPIDTDYIRQIINSEHTIHPDLLQRDPKALQLQLLDSANTFADGDFSMQVYQIGSLSKHTDDYLIYYFPKEHLLFEDDLVGLDKTKPLRVADEREVGLMTGIKKFGLNPETIIQSWPVKKPGDMVIPYSLLEESVAMKSVAPVK